MLKNQNEKKANMKDFSDNILFFGIMAKIYCPKHVGLQLNKIVSNIEKKSFSTVSKSVSDLVSNYPLVYQAWLLVLNRNPTTLFNSKQYHVIKSIIDLFQTHDSQTSLFNYLSIVISNFQKNKLNSDLLQDLIDLHSRLSSQFPASKLLELTIELIAFLPTKTNIKQKQIPVIEEDVYSKDFPPFWCLPHESIQNNKLVDMNKEFEYEGENLDTAPKLDKTYVKSAEIVPCRGFPLYLTNNIAKAYSIGSEGDHYTVERESHQMYSTMLSIMWDKFENLVIQDDHFDAILSLGAIPGIRRRILFRDLYGDLSDRFGRVFKKQSKKQIAQHLQYLRTRIENQIKETSSESANEPWKSVLSLFLNVEDILNNQIKDDVVNSFKSTTIENRCRSNVGKVLKSQYYAARELETYLRAMPDYDLSEFQTFSTDDSPTSFNYKATLTACLLLEEILKKLPSMDWFFDKVIPKTRLVSVDAFSSISLICGNSLANAIYNYYRCVKLLFKFLPLDPPITDEFIHVRNKYVPFSRVEDKIYDQEDDSDDYDSFLEDPYINLYRESYMESESDDNEKNVFDDFFNDQPYEVPIDTYLPNVEEDNCRGKRIPPINPKEDRYYAAIEDFIFFFFNKYDSIMKAKHTNLAHKFAYRFNSSDDLYKLIEESMDHFGSDTKYFYNFCYLAQKLSAMATAVKATSEWKSTKKLLMKFGTASSRNAEVFFESFPRHLFEAREKLHFPLSKVDFSNESNVIKVIPLG